MDIAEYNSLKLKHLRTLEILQTVQRENQKLRKCNADFESTASFSFSQSQVDKFLADKQHEMEERAAAREKDLQIKIQELLANQEEQTKKYREEIQKFSSDMEALAEERKRLQEEGLHRRKSISSMESNMSQLHAEKLQLQAKVLKLENEVEGLAGVNAESERKRKELQDMITKLQGNTAEMNKLLQQFEQQEGLMKKMKVDLESKEQKLKKLLASNKDIQQLKEQLQNEKNRADQLQLDKNKMASQSRSEDLEELHKMKEWNASLVRDNESKSRELKHLASEKRELEGLLEEEQRRFTNQSNWHLQEKDDLEQQLADMARRYKELSDSLVNGKSRFAEFVDLKTENKTLSKKVEELQKNMGRRRRNQDAPPNSNLSDRDRDLYEGQGRSESVQERAPTKITPTSRATGKYIMSSSIANNNANNNHLRMQTESQLQIRKQGLLV